jgi:pimeloyl-ACP methyl ester carboxylesterase
MRPTKADTVRVPGATLYYEVRGSGPTLLLICGGVYDAAGYAGLATQLADRYTVVSYDRRGNSRSPLDGPAEQQSIEVHGDDARRVLAAVGDTVDEPAFVFGNSSGAIIGLELAARHPGQVRTLVAHEPPLFELLPDRGHWRAVIDDVEATFGKDGAAAAGRVLNAAFSDAPGDEASGAEESGDRIPGGGSMPAELDPETMQMMARIEKNMEFFVGYEVPPFARYVPDIDALRTSSTRIVVAVGDASERHQPYYRAAFAVADQLATEPAVLPGDHGGFGAQPAAFANKLHEILSTAGPA